MAILSESFTYHATPDRNLLKNLRMSKVKQIHNIRGQIYQGEMLVGRQTLKSVLHVPTLEYTMISARKLCERFGGSIVICDNTAFLKTPLGQKKIAKKNAIGLFEIVTSQSRLPSTCAPAQPSEIPDSSESMPTHHMMLTYEAYLATPHKSPSPLKPRNSASPLTPYNNASAFTPYKCASPLTPCDSISPLKAYKPPLSRNINFDNFDSKIETKRE